MRISILTDHEPGCIRPLAVRLTSDDGVIDKFMGITDYSDVEQLEELFKSWIQATKELGKQ